MAADAIEHGHEQRVATDRHRVRAGRRQNGHARTAAAVLRPYSAARDSRMRFSATASTTRWRCCRSASRARRRFPRCCRFPVGLLTASPASIPAFRTASVAQARSRSSRRFGSRVSATRRLSAPARARDHHVAQRQRADAYGGASGCAWRRKPWPARFPTFGEHQPVPVDRRSRSDGLTLSVPLPGDGWGSLRASYTLSKALDDAGNAFFSSPQDNANVHDDRGRPTTTSVIVSW